MKNALKPRQSAGEFQNRGTQVGQTRAHLATTPLSGQSRSSGTRIRRFVCSSPKKIRSKMEDLSMSVITEVGLAYFRIR